MIMTTREVLQRLAGGKLSKEEAKEYFALLQRQGRTIRVDRAHLATIPSNSAADSLFLGLQTNDRPNVESRCGTNRSKSTSFRIWIELHYSDGAIGRV